MSLACFLAALLHFKQETVVPTVGQYKTVMEYETSHLRE